MSIEKNVFGGEGSTDNAKTMWLDFHTKMGMSEEVA